MTKKNSILHSSFEALAVEGVEADKAGEKMSGLLVAAIALLLERSYKQGPLWKRVGQQIQFTAAHLSLYGLLASWRREPPEDTWRVLVQDPGGAFEWALKDFGGFTLSLAAASDWEILFWVTCLLVLGTSMGMSWWLDDALEEESLRTAFGDRAESIKDLVAHAPPLNSFRTHRQFTLGITLAGVALLALLMRLLAEAALPSWSYLLVPLLWTFALARAVRHVQSRWIKEDLESLHSYLLDRLSWPSRYSGLWH